MINELNSVTLMGNIAAEPYYEMEDGKVVFGIFRIVSHRNHKHPEKDVITETTFVSCLLHKGLANISSRILSKGDKVVVTGRLVNHEKKVGDVIFTETQVSCDNVIKIPRNKDKGNENE